MRLGVPALLLLALGACADEPTPAPEPLPAPRADTVRLDVGGVPVDARVVMKAAARRRGLMGVRSLGASEGMLFVYRTPASRRFWMQGCLIALDIAYLDEGGTVRQVDTLDPPAAGEEPARTRRSPPAVYALEVRAGFFEEHGLGVGTRVLIPATVNPARADP